MVDIQTKCIRNIIGTLIIQRSLVFYTEEIIEK